MSRVRKGSVIALLACSVVGGFEGYRQQAYPDPATHGPPWTACYGETKGVKYGDRFTLQQCDAKLLVRLDEFGDDIERCVPAARTAPRKMYVAWLSLAYNIGAGGFCKSSVARLANAGDLLGACDAISKFNRAAGVVFPGLTKRRERERVLCLEGFMEAA